MTVSAWTNGFSEEDKEKFLKSLNSSKPILDRLDELLDREISSLEVAEISPKIYDSPNWDYRQAHTNGFKSAIRMVKKIINLDHTGMNNGRQPSI